MVWATAGEHRRITNKLSKSCRAWLGEIGIGRAHRADERKKTQADEQDEGGTHEKKPLWILDRTHLKSPVTAERSPKTHRFHFVARRQTTDIALEKFDAGSVDWERIT